jgi:hypothetical protein
MNTDTDRTEVDYSPLDCVSTIPASDFDCDSDCTEPPHPVQPAEIKQAFCFLTFTVKESIQQTLYAFLQSLKCTYLLVSELHRPYLNSVRALFPLWLAVIHAILLVFSVLAHRTVTDTIQRLHNLAGGPFARFAAWTGHTVPRVFRRLACRSERGQPSALQLDPSTTMAE